MRACVVSAVVVALAFIAGGCNSRRQEVRDSEESSAATIEDALAGDPIYTVKEYDPQRDAATDLATAVATASADGKRILIEIGGQW